MTQHYSNVLRVSLRQAFDEGGAEASAPPYQSVADRYPRTERDPLIGPFAREMRAPVPGGPLFLAGALWTVKAVALVVMPSSVTPLSARGDALVRHSPLCSW